MKKQIFTLVGAILFSLTTLAQDYTGIWQAEEDTSYYVVILYDFEKGYIFTNFYNVDFYIDEFFEMTIFTMTSFTLTIVHNEEFLQSRFLQSRFLQ